MNREADIPMVNDIPIVSKFAEEKKGKIQLAKENKERV